MATNANFLMNLPMSVEIRGGNIGSIVKDKDQHDKVLKGHVVDYGEAVVMPGLVDV